MTVTEESPYVWVDAEIEQRLNLLVSWARTAGENSTEEVTDTELALREAFRDVFRVVNAQREAAVREALEAVRDGHRKDAAEYRKRSTRETAKVNKVLFEGIAEGFERAANVQDRKIDALLAKEAE